MLSTMASGVLIVLFAQWPLSTALLCGCRSLNYSMAAATATLQAPAPSVKYDWFCELSGGGVSHLVRVLRQKSTRKMGRSNILTQLWNFIRQLLSHVPCAASPRSICKRLVKALYSFVAPKCRKSLGAAGTETCAAGSQTAFAPRQLSSTTHSIRNIRQAALGASVSCFCLKARCWWLH